MSNKFRGAIEFFSQLPGIGPRQATRITLALLNWPKEEISKFSEAIANLYQGISLCAECYNFSEEKLCEVCANPRRETAKICVVERITDLQSIEKTGIYRGRYHVLGGAINPVDGFLPKNLKIEALVQRVHSLREQFTNGQSADLEIILATNPNTYGDTTALYIEELLKPLGIKTSRLAKGLSSGSFLEYVDPTTLQNAFKNRR